MSMCLTDFELNVYGYGNICVTKRSKLYEGWAVSDDVEDGVVDKVATLALNMVRGSGCVTDKDVQNNIRLLVQNTLLLWDDVIKEEPLVADSSFLQLAVQQPEGHRAYIKLYYFHDNGDYTPEYSTIRYGREGLVDIICRMLLPVENND